MRFPRNKCSFLDGFRTPRNNMMSYPFSGLPHGAMFWCTVYTYTWTRQQSDIHSGTSASVRGGLQLMCQRPWLDLLILVNSLKHDKYHWYMMIIAKLWYLQLKLVKPPKSTCRGRRHNLIASAVQEELSKETSKILSSWPPSYPQCPIWTHEVSVGKILEVPQELSESGKPWQMVDIHLK